MYARNVPYIALLKIIASIPPDRCIFFGHLREHFVGSRGEFDSTFFLLRHQTLNFYLLIFAPHFLLCCDIVQHYTAGWGRAAIGSREGEAACRGFSACRDFSEAVCRGLSEAACRGFSDAACRGFGGGAQQCGDTVSSCPGHRCCHRGGRQRREAASSCHGGTWQRRCRLQKRQSGKAGIRPGQEQAQFVGAVGDREGG